MHVMYRRGGEPLSLYVFPHVTRPAATAEIFGKNALIWSDHEMTFVLLGEDPVLQGRTGSAHVEHTRGRGRKPYAYRHGVQPRADARATCKQVCRPVAGCGRWTPLSNL